MDGHRVQFLVWLLNLWYHHSWCRRPVEGRVGETEIVKINRYIDATDINMFLRKLEVVFGVSLAFKVENRTDGKSKER